MGEDFFQIGFGFEPVALAVLDERLELGAGVPRICSAKEQPVLHPKLGGF
ncbi:MAG: hypothetical protein ACI9E1_002226 [Cryomorphaceae bacterium]|jgi:hypothetical protein